MPKNQSGQPVGMRLWNSNIFFFCWLVGECREVSRSAFLTPALECWRRAQRAAGPESRM